MAQFNYMRGFNRLYVVVSILWLIGYTCVPPYFTYCVFRAIVTGDFAEA